jgi:hypothetical protein
MTAFDRSDDIERHVDQIRPIVAILVPPDDAEYLVQVINYVEVSSKRQGGAALSERLHHIRAQLAAGVAAVTDSHRCETPDLSEPEVQQSESDLLE